MEMPEPKVTNICFVEDNEVIRFCLRTFLKKIPDFNVLGEAAEGTSGLQLITDTNPEVAVVDIGLPGLNGIELTKELKSKIPQLKVLILTASDNESDIFAALDAGADGYVLKGDYATNLEVAIRSVRVGAVWLDPGIARQVLKATQRPLHPSLPPTTPLSKREESTLNEVANSSCHDGVCLVDPKFLRKLKRFSRADLQMPIMSNES